MRKTANKVKRLLVKQPSLFTTDEAYQMASLRHAPDMAEVIWEVKRAFERGIQPQPSAHGTCGTYFLCDCDHQPIAVFKRDRYAHEVIAYRLDRDHFAGVPQTVITTLEHPLWSGKEVGSLQYFIPDSVAAVEICKSKFDDFPASCVRRIATLDIRVMNEDRHSSNVLVIDHRQKLIPIDHGFILSHGLSNVHLDWLFWNQSLTPFNETERSYIALLDPEYDRKMLLEDFFIEEARANLLFVATILLKMGVVRGLNAADIGTILARKRLGLIRKDEIYSHFEVLIERLKKKNATNWTLFSRAVYNEVNRTLDTYEKATRKYPHTTTYH